MAIDVKIPTVGESITEGTLSRWLKKKGDVVREAEPLFELETDKATSEVPAPATGKLTISVREGETVAVGAVVGQIEPSAEGDGREREPAAKKKEPAEKAKEAKPEKAPSRPPEKEEEKPAEKERPEKKEEKPQPAVAEEEAAPKPPTRKAEAPAPGGERETRQPMSRIRRTIAERLVQAQQTAAILATFNEADVSQVVAIRAQFKDSFKERYGVALGFMSFFVKAVVEALKSLPIVNARIDGNEIVHQNFYDIGVAVSTERGLMVPVIRDADRMSFAELEKAIADYAQKARDGKIAIEDLQGGTFTITNGGVFGSLLSTPILNPPQSAILGMHTIQKRPIVVNEQIAIRPMMYLALSYDHRLIDGREAVQFLGRVKEVIENPQRLLLGM